MGTSVSQTQLLTHGSEGIGQQWGQSQMNWLCCLLELNSSFAFQIDVVNLDVYLPRNVKPEAITINTSMM